MAAVSIRVAHCSTHPFTCDNPRAEGGEANAVSKIQLAIIVLAHKNCGPDIKSLSVRTDAEFDFYCTTQPDTLKSFHQKMASNRTSWGELRIGTHILDLPCAFEVSLSH